MAQTTGRKDYYLNNNMAIPAYDYMENTYDGSQNLTQVDYYRGGPTSNGGSIVATMTMTYDVNGNLLTVERTK